MQSITTKKPRQMKPRMEAEEMQSVILDLTRVTRVQRGGKRMRFRACVCVGDRKGTIGIGIAKGSDVAISVEKATRRAKKDTITVPLNRSGTIPHEISVTYKASSVIFKPAPPGTGIKAGGVIRTICDLAGVKDISAKILGTSNKIANARATFKAFSLFF